MNSRVRLVILPPHHVLIQMILAWPRNSHQWQIWRWGTSRLPAFIMSDLNGSLCMMLLSEDFKKHCNKRSVLKHAQDIGPDTWKEPKKASYRVIPAVLVFNPCNQVEYMSTGLHSMSKYSLSDSILTYHWKAKLMKTNPTETLRPWFYLYQIFHLFYFSSGLCWFKLL